MKLSQETLSIMRNIVQTTQELSKLYSELRTSLLSDTDRSITVVDPVQEEFHLVDLDSISHIDQLDTINSLADEGSAEVRWVDNEKTCYRYTIEGMKCMSLVDKE